MTRAEILQVIDSRSTGNDYVTVLTQLEAWAKSDPHELPSLLEEASSRPLPEHVIAHVRAHCERALAITPGLAQAELALSLVRASPTPAHGETLHSVDYAQRNRVRELARRLASAQPADVLLELLERNEEKDDQFELLCLLVQEMVVQGKAGTQEVLRRLQLEMRGRAHALAALPLHRLALEAQIPLPRYDYRGWSLGGWARPSPAKDARLTPGPKSGWRVRDVTADEDPELVLSAIHDIRVGSGGNFEVKAFAVEGTPSGDPALVASLPLECFAGAREISWIHPYEPASVFANLFGMAATGAEYTQGEGGAYGRLYAWRALAGLTGAPPDSTLEALEARAHACAWTWFEADGEFFQQVINDLGIACRRPEGSISILAASTTD